MSVPLCFDEHVPRAIASGVRRNGIDVLTAEEDGRKGILDEALLDRATALGRLFVTNDKDFLVITAGWLRSGRTFAGLAYYPDQDIPFREAIGSLTLIAEVYSADEVIDHIEYLPL